MTQTLRLLFILVSTIVSTVTLACTGLQLKAKDGSVVNGRTVEFASPIPLNGLIIPRNYAFSGTLPDGTKGLAYKAQYAVVGANAFGEAAIVDGINEKGLVSAAFYFPGYATYTEVTPQNKNIALSPTEFPNWILTQFATVDEVKQNINSAIIVPTSPAGWGITPPFHYVVYDKTGKSIVIEPINGKLVVNDNPIGVITNSPTFDWHLTNLSNYLNLSPMNAPSKIIDGYKLNSFGQGSGLHGLPGDFSPPSRFVRAAIFSSAATPVSTATPTIYEAFHLLNQFDIPPGAVGSKTNGKATVDRTLATTVKDPQGLNYYFKTYDDQNIKMISLSAFDLNSKELKSIPMTGMQPVKDISANAQNGLLTLDANHR
ncbi:MULTISPECIES: linear amide C-N hydrolase [unclassified Legionella]|uniref:linear amide C-N hydrolase n=1 Tax=unclassified Legionella TaxID=2622702 RepID=UPI0010557F4C|nr:MULTISPECIES: choloylglycine hydrolase family protein [unclassified Legionella]MDI9818797.1 choloylglycine hydrolase family protein [Legionella sp. PL877]